MAAPTCFPASLFPSLPFPMSTFTTLNNKFRLLFLSYQLQTLFVSLHGGLYHAYYLSLPLFPNLTLSLITSLADSKALVLQLRPLLSLFPDRTNLLCLVLRDEDIHTHRYPIAFPQLYLSPWQQF